MSASRLAYGWMLLAAVVVLPWAPIVALLIVLF